MSRDMPAASYQPPGWSSRKDAPAPTVFLEHVEYLFDGNSEATNHVLDYIAHLVQQPAERVSHALLITSKAKGIGKSTFGAIIRRLVGEQNSRVVQTKDLKAQFDGWLVGKLVVQVDEVYEAGNWDLANKLKPLITERTVSVNNGNRELRALSHVLEPHGAVRP
jgi:phage/plasmid-associated DNA primase